MMVGRKKADFIKVNWHDEGLEGDNEGLIYGIYILSTNDLSRSSIKKYGLIYFDQEIEDVMWFKTEQERDKEFIKFNKEE
tara:strand:+ start:1700 stop:1939 length:240 start_codon:yes stop_codon:yes gene_type:complete